VKKKPNLVDKIEVSWVDKKSDLSPNVPELVKTENVEGPACKREELAA
jgi:hypothetical protein